MKKKIFALITAVALVAILCLSLVACDDNENNDGNDLSPITFSDKMSEDEIIETIGKIKNYTLEVHVTTSVDEVNPDLGYAYAEYYFGENYFYLANGYKNKMTFISWIIVEGTRYYQIDQDRSDDVITEIGITDFDGYDTVDLCQDDILDELEGVLEIVAELVPNGNYVVENGALKVAEDAEYRVYYVLKDCNTTKMPAVPEEVKDYKNMDANLDVIEYELSSNEEYYILDEISWFLISYEVPATYNGKPVTRFEESCSSANLKTLTLPTSITYLNWYCDDVDDGELHIIYKGTKAQWEAIENSDVWSKTEGVRITCSDGDYVVATQE